MDLSLPLSTAQEASAGATPNLSWDAGRQGRATPLPGPVGVEAMTRAADGDAKRTLSLLHLGCVPCPMVGRRWTAAERASPKPYADELIPLFQTVAPNLGTLKSSRAGWILDAAPTASRAAFETRHETKFLLTLAKPNLPNGNADATSRKGASAHKL